MLTTSSADLYMYRLLFKQIALLRRRHLPRPQLLLDQRLPADFLNPIRLRSFFLASH